MTGFNKIISTFKKDKDITSNRNSFNFSDNSYRSEESDGIISRRDQDTDEYIDKNIDKNIDKDIYSDINVNLDNNYETKYNFKDNSYIIEQNNKKNIFICEMCNKNGDNAQYIILNCNHIYHIQCLANNQLNTAINCQIIDNTFFNNIRCNCGELLESSEIMMIQNKFYKGTTIFIGNHDKKIDKLEDKINILKEEMKICMEYKQRLEFEQQKSKQIITMLNTMPL